MKSAVLHVPPGAIVAALKGKRLSVPGGLPDDAIPIGMPRYHRGAVSFVVESDHFPDTRPGDPYPVLHAEALPPR